MRRSLTVATPRFLYLLLLVSPLATAADNGADNGYVGRAVCASCHVDVAKTQAGTNMARAWEGLRSPQLAADYSATFEEGPDPAIHYAVKKSGGNIQFHVQMPGQSALDFPVETLIGGDRHGLSFILRVPDLKGWPLARAPLVEARYFHYREQNKLALELGFPEAKPSTYETALGRVLTPHLEKRCLACHGAPRTHGTRVDTGVDCESCHGPGREHLAALSSHSKDLRILNPGKLPVADRMKPCAQCHAGGSDLIEDPMPDDTLISDQVTAIKNSECSRQSGGAITCSNCHDPHRDAPASVIVERSEKTCQRCHSTSTAKHAGLCPVNRTSGCVGCHMPDAVRGAFIMADHWIRVHPGQKAEVTAHDPAWRTTLTPKRLFLRILVLDDESKAAAIHKQLLDGGSFFDLARSNSVDRETAPNGGYAGDLAASRFDPAWSAPALTLQPGQLSGVIAGKGKYFILQRMSRDFREDAEAVFNRAMDLRKQGKPQESMRELLEALKIYPHLLRALTWLGAMYGQSGNPSVSAGILNIATRLYPQDSGAHYNLALAYGALADAKEIPEYRRALEIDPDLVLAYLNWGASLYARGDYDQAVTIYRQGIDVNPLVASLHYNLGLALEQQHKNAEAEVEIALAAKIDPTVGAR